MVDKAKFFAGTLSAMSAMIMLELPHVNILSKMDLVKDRGVMGKKEFRKFLDPDATLVEDDDYLMPPSQSQTSTLTSTSNFPPQPFDRA